VLRSVAARPAVSLMPLYRLASGRSSMADGIELIWDGPPEQTASKATAPCDRARRPREESLSGERVERRRSRYMSAADRRGCDQKSMLIHSKGCEGRLGGMTVHCRHCESPNDRNRRTANRQRHELEAAALRHQPTFAPGTKR
jgi:hypothetical protein